MNSYQGYKNVLIKSSEGNILIKDIPKCIRRLEVMDRARQEIAPNKEKLNNIKYIINPNELDIDFKFVKVVEFRPPYYSIHGF